MGGVTKTTSLLIFVVRKIGPGSPFGRIWGHLGPSEEALAFLFGLLCAPFSRFCTNFRPILVGGPIFLPTLPDFKENGPSWEPQSLQNQCFCLSKTWIFEKSTFSLTLPQNSIFGPLFPPKGLPKPPLGASWVVFGVSLGHPWPLLGSPAAALCPL